MMFVYPSFLWALLALSIPIIIHLFNFRRYKKVYFTNVQFLKELQLESKSKSRLKELLILLTRMLAIACLVLAFAQPILTNKQNNTINLGHKTVGIYLDNSFSMEAINKQGQLLETSKKTAKEIIHSYKTTDRFHLITNDFEGKHQRLYTKEDALAEINDIKISPSVKRYSDVLKRQKEFLSSENKGSIVLFALTDAQRSSFDLQDIKNDSLTSLTIIPIEANQTDNVYIDSCWFESPIQQKGFIQKLNVIIKNNSQKTIDAGTVRLTVNANQTAIGSFSLESNATKSLSISFTIKNEGLNYASVKLDDYPIVFDDELFFTFNSKLTINTVLINAKDASTATYFNSLFSADSLFNYTQLAENAIDYSKFKNADLIILNELENLSNGLLDELIRFSDKGGSIVIIPYSKADLTKLNSFYASLDLPQISVLDTHALKLSKPEGTNPFFEGVFEKIDPQINLPLSLQHFSYIKNTRRISQPIYAFPNNEPFLSRSVFKNASIYLFASSLGDKQGNFCKHALFVPTFIRLAVTSVKPQPLFYILNNSNSIALRSENINSEAPPHIIGYKSKIDLIPEMRLTNNNLNLYVDKQINEAGFYNVVWQDQIKQNLAFNYNRIESNLNFYTLDELNEIIIKNNLTKYSLLENINISDASKAIQTGIGGLKLWKWFILLTLLFIAIEMCLIRLLK